MGIISIEQTTRPGLIAEAGKITRGEITHIESVSEENLDKWLTSEHSPIRRVRVAVIMSVSPSVISHLTRHIHAEHFVESGRPDLTGKPRDGSDRLYLLEANLQEWMQIARKRLCFAAADETRKTVETIRERFSESQEPVIRVLSRHMIPRCVYEGVCREVWKEDCPRRHNGSI